MPEPSADLIGAFKNRRVVPWIGAGLSSAVVGTELPGYGELIATVTHASTLRAGLPKEVANRINEHNEAGAFKEAATLLRGNIDPKDFTLIIRDLLRSTTPRPSQHHVMLNLMNFPIFLTTNYDRVLDLIVRPRPEVLTYRDSATLSALLSDRASLFRSGEAPKIFKLNGDLAAPQTIVLGQAEALGLFDPSAPLGRDMEEMIYNVMRDHTLLFMGYSFEDPDYRQLLMKVGDALGSDRRTHYALLPAQELNTVRERELLEKRAGVVFQTFDLDDKPEDGDSYRALWQFLSQIPRQDPTFKPRSGQVARTFYPGSERPSYLKMQDDFERNTDVFRFITPTLTNGFATHEYLEVLAPPTLENFKEVVGPEKWPTWTSDVVKQMKSRASTFAMRLRGGAEARILCSAKRLADEIATGDPTVLARYTYVLDWLDDPNADVELRLYAETEDSVSLTSFASLMCGSWSGSDIAVAYATQATVAAFNTHVFEINTEFSKDMLVIFEREWARALPSKASAEVVRDALKVRALEARGREG
ncbi:MAG: SIR2 family protein [Pseudomonadota bacterium]